MSAGRSRVATGCRAHTVAALLALGAWAPAAVQAQKPAPELTACAAANRQAASELLLARENELRRHALHAVLVSRLHGLGGSFGLLKAAAARHPRKLTECEQTAEALALGREQLDRIVGPPEALAACMAGNQAEHVAMQTTLLGLQSSGNASMPALEAAAARLALLRPAMTREDLTLADCRQLATEVQLEKQQVLRLLPAPPVAAGVPTAPATSATAAATDCRAALKRAYNDVAQAYAEFVNAGPLAQEWMATLQSLSERLTRLSQSIAAPAPAPAVPGGDCELLQNALAQARSELGALKR